MQLELSSKQIEKLIDIVGRDLDKIKTVEEGNFLFRLYLRLVTQAHEQGIDICENVQSVEAQEPN